MELFKKKRPKHINKTNTQSKLNVGNIFRDLIGGNVLLSEVFQKQLKLIVLLFFLSLIYINNGFVYERELRELDEKREKLQDLKNRSIIIMKDYTHMVRRLTIQEELAIQGSDLKDSDEPAVIIE